MNEKFWKKIGLKINLQKSLIQFAIYKSTFFFLDITNKEKRIIFRGKHPEKKNKTKPQDSISSLKISYFEIN